MEYLNLSISVIAISFSFCSLCFTYKFWHESNRPIVTAYIEVFKEGNISTVFNLIVVNSGSRPANDIQLKAKNEDIDSIMHEDADKSLKKIVHNCFQEDSKISILNHGESLSTSFGCISTSPENNLLKPLSELPVTIVYSGLSKKKFKTKLNLYVGRREGFGGGVWNKRT